MVVDGEQGALDNRRLLEGDGQRSHRLIDLLDLDVDQIADLEHLRRHRTARPHLTVRNQAVPHQIRVVATDAQPHTGRRRRFADCRDERGNDVAGRHRALPPIRRPRLNLAAVYDTEPRLQQWAADMGLLLLDARDAAAAARAAGKDRLDPDILTSFIAQYYLDRPAPHELIVSHPLEDAALLVEVLSAQSHHAVEIKDSVRGERARFLELAGKNADAALAMHLASNQTMRERFEALRDLLDLGETPQRLECFDISHTMGEAAVASCVVYDRASMQPSEYRRYNIAGIEPGDDYAAMRQVLDRRYRKIVEGEGRLPDLILIDGGKGQVGAAYQVLGELGLSDLPMIGVAKGEERKAGLEQLIYPDRNEPLRLPADNPGLHLIQQIRDEIHQVVHVVPVVVYLHMLRLHVSLIRFHGGRERFLRAERCAWEEAHCPQLRQSCWLLWRAVRS